MIKRVIVAGAFAGSILLSGCAKDGDQVPVLQVADGAAVSSIDPDARSMPEFTEMTLAGDSLSTSDLAGKVTLVNFWATWCGPCIVETPALVALRNEWEGREFEIVGVAMDEEGLSAIGAFAERFEIPYPLISDLGPLAEEFGGVYALPTTFVVDSDGEILHRFIGVFPVEEMRNELDKMISPVLVPPGI